jgi:hypothetical protein
VEDAVSESRTERGDDSEGSGEDLLAENMVE